MITKDELEAIEQRMEILSNPYATPRLLDATKNPNIDETLRLCTSLREAWEENERLRTFAQNCSQVDDCGCEHDNENCCAKVGYPCVRCSAATLLAELEREER